MASGYKLYCHDEFNDMSVYPSSTEDYVTHMGVITHLPVPPSIPNNYSFDGWYSDPDYTDEVLVGEIFNTSTENKVIVVHIYAKWVEERTVFSSMTTLANEIRELSGTSESIGLDAMISHVNDANVEVDTQSDLIDQLSEMLDGKAVGGGDTSVEDAIVTGTLTEYSNDRVEVINNGVFKNYTSLTSVEFPNVTSIDGAIFYGCTSLTSADFPKATSIGNSAFHGCTSLTSADFPKATSIGNSAFQNCTSLISVEFPNVTSIDGDIFYGCTSLTSVVLPNITRINHNVFCDCTSLTSVDFSNVTSMIYGAFQNCTSLTSVVLRNTNTICETTDEGMFELTPIEYGTGYIYVPSSLIESYKNDYDYGWYLYANQYRALEDYTVDGTITGALDPDKIDSNPSNAPSFTIDDIVYYTDGNLNWDEWIESEYNTDDFYIDGKYGPLLIISSSDGTIRSLVHLEGEGHISYDVEPEDFVQPGGTYTWYILGQEE